VTSPMALLAHQTTLGRHLRTGDPGVPMLVVGTSRDLEAGLDAGHRTQLAELIASPDFVFTQFVRQSWCVGRTKALARLTLSVLSEEAGRNLVDHWVARGGGAAFDPMSEAEGLFEFAAARLEDPSHALTICRMEQAALRASAAALTFAAPDLTLDDEALTFVCRGKGAGLVRFFAPPERLLACVSAGEPLPALTEESLPILFTPGLAELCRPATEEETAFWESLQAPASAAALMQEGYPRRLISSMLDIGAIDLSSRTLAATVC
jgi:hypothetical protein